MFLFDKGNFRGGAHPPQEKESTSGKPIEEIPLPPRVIIPLSQRTGVQAKPLASIGETVLKGQKIGEGEGRFSSNIHSSISGKVKKIINFPHPLGIDSLSIIIESDGEDRMVEGIDKKRPYEDLTASEINSIIREAGIVGLGGAEFPANVKLSPPPDKKIECVILNGAECEPFLTSDHRLMLEKPEYIIEGLKILMNVVSAKKAIIGVENNKIDAIKALKKASHRDKNIDIKGLKVKYPQGGEKILIKSLLNREIPTGCLPLDVGVLVQNIGTTFAIYEAVAHGMPLIRRVVTVTGAAVKTPKNLLARIGTPLEFLIDQCGGFNAQPEQIIMGGPMMGQAQFTLEVPVIKGTSGIVALLPKGNDKKDIMPCIRCGRCMNSCPLGLSPSLFGIYGEKGMIDNAELIGVKECMECGVCSYVCPARRPVGQFIKSIKHELRKRDKK